MIRHARPADHAAIREIVAAAFGQADEADLVERLRAADDVMFELVEEENGEVVGHILYSRLWADSVNLYAALAPLAVRPDRQRDGVGKRLTAASIETAKDFGAHAVIVLGHPEYYPKFGFSAQAAAQVKSPYSGSPAFMALALEDGALDGPLLVAYPDAFGGGEGH
ncbi:MULTISPECIES: GNAT family N-acetyltransferase [unclassified Phenylobacterium]|uniref:GNAT family N-acetyltransferase n=1 Tax=unclassified Phenylobacterium TaxID=2640670 RepID=UPI002264EA5C|nr:MULTISPECIES: N-acetyltransferase [unclassified Phenylobacterium]MBS0492090.1 N-acetyltransferase [Pseudomonadota bacterium]MCX7588193.1 N-acetyltransferase [Phenylobacterium sp. 58.2.17]WGU41653.1 N-acetyltransferase [Phenylobacterium sp. NIBR 498073]